MNLQDLKNTLQGNEGFYLPPPGFSFDELDAFLEWIDTTLFNNEAGIKGLIPDELVTVLSGISIYSLAFIPTEGQDPVRLSFTLKWDNTSSWAIIPGEFSIQEIEVSLDIIGKQATALLAGTLAIEQYNFTVSAELPSLYVKAELVPLQGTHPSAADLFKRFKTGKLENKDGNTPTLTDFTFIADPRTKTAILHLGIDNINIGPVDIAAQLELNYYGRPKGQLTGALWSEYIIKRSDDPENPVKIAVLAEHDSPEEGWDFKGAISVDSLALGHLIEHFYSDFDKDKKFTLPQSLENLNLNVKYLGIEFNTSTKHFSFSCEVDFFDQKQSAPEKSPDVDMIIDFDLTRQVDPKTNVAAYAILVSGQIIFTLDTEKMAFDLVFDKEKDDTTFLAVYKDLAGGTISIGNLIHALDPTFGDFPFQISLKDAFFAYENVKGQTNGSTQNSGGGEQVNPGSHYLFGLDIGGGINLSQLPLVGKMFSPSDNLKIAFQALVASGPQSPFFNKQQLEDLSGLIPGGGITLPDQDLTTNVDLKVLLDAGGKSITMDLPIEFAQDKKSIQEKSPAAAKEESSSKPGAFIEDTNSPGADTPGAASTPDGGNIKWYNLQKSFGPVSVNRIGVQYAKGDIKVLFDAGLSAAGLTISLDGLGLETNLSDITANPPKLPTFSLNGLGLDFKRGPLEIGGAFLRQEIPASGDTQAYEEYDGLVLISFKTFSLSAIGSYAQVNGQTSLFIYGVLEMPFGGPPFFLLTGLAAGFGYNRRLTMPPIDQVESFPLIEQAMSGSAAIPSDPSERGSFLQQEITSLSQYVPPQIGEYFLVAGLRFSSFELIDSFALLAISFGKDFELDILGLSTLVIPTPEEGSTVSPLAEVQLAIKVAFNPDAGYLEAIAQLTNNSFILSRDCHLTGGFAFYVWFKDQPQPGALNGEFVLSIGGYHPQFVPPPYYPTVPRLGFNWQVTPQLFIKGGAYFALVPHAVMAGGGLEVVWQSGSIQAWFKAGADFLISWKPYFYMADIYVDMGVSATINFFGAHHLTLDLGADLSIWGPDFSGIAHIHILIFTIPISFGNAKPTPQPISWENFRQSFLPADDKICNISVESGLIKKIEKDANGQGRSIINPKDFSIVTDAQLPSTAASLGKTQLNGKTFGVAPMALPAVQSSVHTVTITGGGEEASFNASPVTKNVPAAMWGGELSPKVNGEKMVTDAMTGLRITPANPPTPGATHSILRSNLKYETDPIKNDFTQAYHVFTWRSDPEETQDFINAKLVASETVNKRNILLGDLGFNPDITVINLDTHLTDSFVGAPIIGSWDF